MAIKNSFEVYIDGINRTAKAVMPLKWADFLDERLDECTLSLRGVKRKNFQPLTPVEIVFHNEHYLGDKNQRKIISSKTLTKYYVIADDNATEMQVGSDFYNHELYIIESTKSSECVIADTLTYTNDIGRNYAEDAGFAEPIWE